MPFEGWGDEVSMISGSGESVRGRSETGSDNACGRGSEPHLPHQGWKMARDKNHNNYKVK